MQSLLIFRPEEVDILSENESSWFPFINFCLHTGYHSMLFRKRVDHGETGDHIPWHIRGRKWKLESKIRVEWNPHFYNSKPENPQLRRTRYPPFRNLQRQPVGVLFPEADSDILWHRLPWKRAMWLFWSKRVCPQVLFQEWFDRDAVSCLCRVGFNRDTEAQFASWNKPCLDKGTNARLRADNKLGLRPIQNRLCAPRSLGRY